MPEVVNEVKVDARRQDAGATAPAKADAGQDREFLARLRGMKAAGGQLPVDRVRGMMSGLQGGALLAFTKALRSVASEAEIARILSGGEARGGTAGDQATGDAQARPATGRPGGEVRGEADRAGAGRDGTSPGKVAPDKAGKEGPDDPAKKAAKEGKAPDDGKTLKQGEGDRGAAQQKAAEGAKTEGQEAAKEAGKEAVREVVQEGAKDAEGEEQAEGEAGAEGGDEAPLAGKELIAAEFSAHEQWKGGLGKAGSVERTALALDATLKGLGAGMAGGATHLAIGQASGLLTRTAFKKVPMAGPILTLAMNYNAFTPGYWTDTFSGIRDRFAAVDFKHDAFGSTASLLTGVADILGAVGTVASIVSALGYAISAGSFLLTFVFPPAAAVIAPAFTVGRIANTVFTVAGIIEPLLRTIAAMLSAVKLVTMEGDPREVKEAAKEYQEGLTESAGLLTSMYGAHKIEQWHEPAGKKGGFVKGQWDDLKEGLKGGPREEKGLGKEIQEHLAESAKKTGEAKQAATAQIETAEAAPATRTNRRKAGQARKALGGAKGRETQIKRSKLAGEMTGKVRGDSIEHATYSDVGLGSGEKVAKFVAGEHEGEVAEGGEARGHEPLPEPPGSPAELQQLEQGIQVAGGVVEDRAAKSEALGARARKSDEELKKAGQLRERLGKVRAAGGHVDQVVTKKRAKADQAQAKVGEAKARTAEGKGRAEPFSTILGPLEKVEWLADHCPRNPIFNVQSARANIKGFKAKLVRARDFLNGRDSPMQGPADQVGETRKGLDEAGPKKAAGDAQLGAAGQKVDAIASEVTAGKGALLGTKGQMDKESADARTKRKELEALYRKKMAEMESWAQRHRAARLASEG